MLTVKQLLCFTVCGACAAAAYAHGVDPSFFPGVEDYSDAAIRLHGLAELYPGRVLFENPSLETVSSSHEAARVEDLPRDIKYIRLYRLDEAQRVIDEYQAYPALIVDFRYLKSELAAVNILDAFAPEKWTEGLTTVGLVPEALIETADSPTSAREKPVIVLVNRETAGPFEATLDQLQQKGAIIAIGEATAGRTGFYRKSEPGAWTLNGEIQSDGDTSLIGTGFQPHIQMETSAAENYLAYHLYEAGTDINRLLRQDTHTADHSEETDPIQKIEEPDRVLQRAVDIVAALQILQ